MQSHQPAFIAALTNEASAAEIAELEFRKSVAQEIATRERHRQFAYRRLDLAKTILGAVRSADTEEAAVGAGLGAFKRELVWNTETEARKVVLAAFTPVVQAIWRQAGPEPRGEPGPSPMEAMATFEAWYKATHGTDLLAVFDVDLPELPVVEF